MALKVYNRVGITSEYVVDGEVISIPCDVTRTALTGLRTFLEELSDGDEIDVLVKKDEDNWELWRSTYGSANEELVKQWAHCTLGTVSDEDVVEVTAVLTKEMFDELTLGARVGFEIITEDTLIADADWAPGVARVIFVDSSSGAVELTLGELLRNVALEVIRTGTNNVVFTPDTDCTINGGASSITLSTQWTGAKVYINGTEDATAWVVVTF
jgi:hypothetical protein